MSTVRKYESGDAAAVDKLLEAHEYHDVRIDRDLIMVCVSSAGVIIGLTVGRPVILVHELVLNHSLGDLSIAKNLVKSGCEFAADLGFTEMAFVVANDNNKMQRFIEKQGARREENVVVYSLQVTSGQKDKGEIHGT